MARLEQIGDRLTTAARAIWRLRNGKQSPATHRTSRLAELGLVESELDHGAADAFSSYRQYDAEEELSRVADEAERQLAEFEKLIGRSHEEAQSYGSALQDNAAQLQAHANGRQKAASLIELTNVMIAKTRAATEELRFRREEMGRLQGSLKDARARADTDMLTELANRRCFERSLAEAVDQAAADRAPLSLAVCDIDHFKQINDQFGHQTGDGVLRLVAQILEKNCGKQGTAFRLGGEEFALIFPGCGEAEAFSIAELARRDLASRKIRQRETGDYLGKVTLSAGIATLDVVAPDSADLLFSTADRELYVAKEAGRDRISSAMVGD